MDRQELKKRKKSGVFLGGLSLGDSLGIALVFCIFVLAPLGGCRSPRTAEMVKSLSAGKTSGDIHGEGELAETKKLFPVQELYDKKHAPLGRPNFGYIDRTGRIVIEPRFTWAYEFTEGLARVQIGSRDGYIDTTGKVVIKPQFYRARQFSEGLAPVGNIRWLPIGLKWGFIDKTGRMVIKQQFSQVSHFSEGLAAVAREGEKWGYIDKTGRYVVSPQFDYAGDFSEGLAVVEKSGKLGYIDKAGRALERAIRFSEGLAAIEVGGKWGFVDKKGSVAICPRFDDVEGFSEGLAAVRIDRSWGFVDKEGRVVVHPRFDDVEGFSEGLAAVKVGGTWHEKERRWDGGKWGFVDKTGKMAIAPQFDEVWPFCGGLALGEIDLVRGCYHVYVDKEGKFVWDPANLQGMLRKMGFKVVVPPENSVQDKK